jgi:uncharacterized protein (TIGR02265 family)
MEVLDRVCDYQYPELTREAGREAVGRLIFEGIGKGLFGALVLQSLHIMKADGLMRLIKRFFDATGGVGRRSVEVLNASNNSYKFSSRRVSGTYEEEVGAIKAALEEAGATNVQIAVEVLATDSWDYYISWDKKES